MPYQGNSTTGNQYYVHPGQDFGTGLTGLGQGLRGLAGEFQRNKQMKFERDKEDAKAERFAEIGSEAQRVFQSKDPVEIMNFARKYPEAGEAVRKNINAFNKETEKSYKDASFRILQSKDPREQIIKEQADREILFDKWDVPVSQRQESRNALIEYDKNPEEWMEDRDNEMMVGWNDDYTKIQKSMSGGDAKSQYSPSPLKKSINERQEYIDAGMSEDDPIMQAYDREITGVDKGALVFTPQQLDVMGVMFAKTGKMPSLGRGKESTRARLEIASKGAAYQLREEGFGEYVDKGVATGRTPIDAAMAAIGDQSDTKAIQGSLNFLDKQLSSMGSFVTNLNSQVDKVNELAKDLKTSDIRLLNKPIRSLRGKLKGSALQAKYDMYLTEIESEIGKLATGSTGSVSELSVGAQEKWSQIHDKNLSVKDMLSLLEETKKAANFRIESVEGQLNKTRARMRSENRDFNQGNTPEATATGPNGEKIGLFNGEWRPI